MTSTIRLRPRFKLLSWTPRVSIPSIEGRYSRILNDAATLYTLASAHGDNLHTVRVSIIAWTSLLADSPLGHKPNAVINKFLNELINDYKGTCARLSDLADDLSRMGRHDRESQTVIIEGDLSGYKRTPVFKEVLNFVRTGDAQTLRYVLTVLQFGAKIGYKDESLELAAFRQWAETEQRLEQAHLPAYIDSLRAVVHWLFKRWSPGPFLPKHGSGSVAQKGVWGSEGKNRGFELDPWLDKTYQSRADIDTYGSSTPDGSPSKLVEDVRHSAARLAFVPKDL